MGTNGLKITDLLDLNETIATSIFDGLTYPWEALSKISAYILVLGATLPESEYTKITEDIWISKTAKVAPTASITGPAIIGHKCRSAALCLYPRKCNSW